MTGEYVAARNSAVLFDHPNRGIIEVSGNDRISFLQNVLSNDIKSLAPGHGIPACLLEARAKIIAQVNALMLENVVWLAFDYSLKEKLLKALGALVIMEEVGLKDRSDELKLLSIHGPKASEVLSQISKISLPREMLSHAKAMSGIIIRINLIGETGYGILILKNEAEILKKELGKLIPEISAQTLDTLRIEAGIPKYGVDFDESSIPLEVRLDNAVSFSKGCFPGQEILARLDSRGGVSKKLSGIVLEGKEIPKKRFKILKNNQEIGFVTSAAFSPKLNKVIALGLIKKEFWEPGTEILVGQIPAKVAKLPF